MEPSARPFRQDLFDNWLGSRKRAKLEDGDSSPLTGTDHAHFACRCCGYLTLHEPPLGSYEICQVCRWEDDPVQGDDPDFAGGANRPSLNQARKNFAELAVSDRVERGRERPPLPEEIPET